eukprot:jgi/Tetstr1/444671/TSEL_032519.t1
MGCSASVAAEPDKPVPTNPVSTASGRTNIGGCADGVRPALKSGPSMKGLAHSTRYDSCMGTWVRLRMPEAVLLPKSTGVVPKVFVESIFSTYDLNGDGTISQSELQGLAADLQANYGHLKHALIGDDNPDGTVTRDALMNWFYNDHSTQQMRTIFDQMDADGSGFIEAEEIPNVLKLCAENISEENIAIAMSTLDRDGDMKVSFEEFSHWFNNDCKLVTYRSFFSLYASNGDGKDKIGLAELKEMLVAMGGKEEHLNVQAVMDEIDTNKNGLVELEEFIVWSVKNN